ncbi:prolyl-tRNA editing enzyme YbaK/EbsC (Cys-tRNA(Pro) deacylase) [Saccharomonospora amisosensis]|uniref:Prolyl-tRNA editing enzyme YbaK/EbsC (Cys-tRNA(Pro) deacylase) n=1 Tax=Saccharomonospora amisosensis TaxID=1128677 RepID=A0A7X5UND0_9PSEU|nr:YbaK/EbsC family protein [Saccharomonospora amisosensis]NIJ11195.1 prolyl-tRNA editing enzyme YbaK/EbsC (Cys-tRNA(Pro) deacylase) [Saccharomonospora amisosensis]
MSTLDHPAVAKVAAALVEAGQVRAAEGIRILPDDARTAAQAATALGVEVGAIANSLVFTADISGHGEVGEVGEVALLALTSGAHRANTATLARLAGAEEVGKADPDFVRRHTGQVIGGVAPVGHPSRLLTVVDTALREYDTVWAAAGHPKSVFPTTFEDLLRLTGGRAADVASALDGTMP